MNLAARVADAVVRHAPSAVIAKMTGLAYWEALRWDGKVYREVDGIDWMELPKRGLVDLRLIAPDGTGRGFGNTTDASGRFFQFKGATLMAGMGAGGSGRTRDYHLIGMIRDERGQCICWVWDHRLNAWLPPIADNFYAMQFENIGGLNPALLG